eukprot:gene4254-19164_t
MRDEVRSLPSNFNALLSTLSAHPLILPAFSDTKGARRLMGWWQGDRYVRVARRRADVVALPPVVVGGSGWTVHTNAAYNYSWDPEKRDLARGQLFLEYLLYHHNR